MTTYIKRECYGDRTHTPCSKCPYLHYPFCTENMDEEQKRIIIGGDDVNEY